MQLQGRIGRSMLLFTLMLLVVPMLVFPELFGTKLIRLSVINAFYELAYYGLVVFLLNRRMRLVQLLQAGGVCLLYRFGLGAAFGLLVALVYRLDLGVAITMGLWSYLPVIFLHVAATPFVLASLLQQICRAPVPRRYASQEPTTGESSEEGRTSISISREKGVVTQQSSSVRLTATAEKTVPVPPATESVAAAVAGHTNGFERAARYIGELGSVHLACVIDHEGLLLASFCRGEIVPEDWAPLAERFILGNECVLDSCELGSPEKIEVTLREKRVAIARDEHCSLMVISERQSDDLLNIRINQATEMINRYFVERYSEKAVTNAERVHV